MPIVILILGKTTIVESTLMMISAKVIETSVIIADYLQSHRLRLGVLLLGGSNVAVQWYSCVQTSHCLTLIMKRGSREILTFLVIH